MLKNFLFILFFSIFFFLFLSFSFASCPNQCNGKGICNSEAICECEAPFDQAPDCSLSKLFKIEIEIKIVKID